MSGRHALRRVRRHAAARVSRVDPAQLLPAVLVALLVVAIAVVGLVVLVALAPMGGSSW